MVSGKKKSHIGWIIAVILAIFWLLVAFVPFMFMVLTGFKEKLEVILGGALAFPKSLYLDNYISIITDLAFWNYFKNSVIVLILALFLLLLFSAFAAYPLSRFKFKGRGFMYFLIVACMSIPIHVTMIPVFQMAISTHMYDTIWILIPMVGLGEFLYWTLVTWLLARFLRINEKTLRIVSRVAGGLVCVFAVVLIVRGLIMILGN